MPRKRVVMRQVREVLRLKWACGLSDRQIAQGLRISRPTVADYVRRAQRAGLSWPLPEPLDDPSLERQLEATVEPPAWTWPHETLLVNSILISENRSPFSEKHYKMYSFVGQEGFLLSDQALIWVAPSPLQSAILDVSSNLIRQHQNDIVVLQGGE